MLLDNEQQRFKVLAKAIHHVIIPTYYEFGVATGQTINFIANLIKPHKITGFDWFHGLPEKWGGFEVGTFASNGVAPFVSENVELVHGLFEDTLPMFKFPENVGFIHIDSDLYSSAKTILQFVPICKGTVIVFDEFWNYPGFEKHEWLAMKETGLKYEIIAQNEYEQVAIKIL